MDNFLVFQSDFGLVDGAVSSMVGVALSFDDDLKIHHLTHEITPYNIFEASYRLIQTIKFWPKGSVFVSVVDPGVGSWRKSVVVKTKSGHYVVTPNNGTLTHIVLDIGVEEIREIDTSIHQLPDSYDCYTFHGRDVYAYTGAKLASGKISFEEVGPILNADEIILLPLLDVEYKKDSILGHIDILDVRFGSLWTDIDAQKFYELFSLEEKILVNIFNNGIPVYENVVLFTKSFAGVNIGSPLIYINSLYRVALAINQGNFSKAYNIGVGGQWAIEFKKIKNN